MNYLNVWNNIYLSSLKTFSFLLLWRFGEPEKKIIKSHTIAISFMFVKHLGSFIFTICVLLFLFFIILDFSKKIRYQEGWIRWEIWDALQNSTTIIHLFFLTTWFILERKFNGKVKSMGLWEAIQTWRVNETLPF